MRQKTNENKSTSCVYQELNPEMDAFLAGYLEDGRHRGLRESTIHLHDKIGHYFLSAVTETGCLKPQEMDAHSIGAACLRIRSRWYLSHIRTFLRYAYHSGYTGRDYSGVVPLFKRPQPYPSVYTAEEILKIENSVDQDSPHGKRDYRRTRPAAQRWKRRPSRRQVRFLHGFSSLSGGAAAAAKLLRLCPVILRGQGLCSPCRTVTLL